MTTVTARREPGIIAPSAGRQPRKGRTNWTATTILIIGGLYCILPSLWIFWSPPPRPTPSFFSTAPYVPSFTGAFWSERVEIVTYNHESSYTGRSTVIYAVSDDPVHLFAGSPGTARQVPRFAGSTANLPHRHRRPSCSRRC